MDCGSIPPKTCVPPGWIHPTLKKQLRLRGRMAGNTADRLAELVRQHSEMDSGVRRMQHAIGEKRARLVEMERRVRQLSSEIAVDAQRIDTTVALVQRVGDQLILQKTFEPQEVILSPCLPNAFMLCGGVGKPLCGLTIVPFEAFFVPTPAKPCEETDVHARRRFLTRFASLFSTQGGTAGEAIFFDEPCLMAPPEGASCGNTSCPYWHKDQLAHVRRAADAFVASGIVLCDGVRPDRCDAAAHFVRLHRRVHSPEMDVATATRALRDAIRTAAAFGWAACLTMEAEKDEDEDEDEDEANRVSAGGVRLGARSSVHILRRAARLGEAPWRTQLGSIHNAFDDVRSVSSLLRDAAEQTALLSAGHSVTSAVDAFRSNPGPLTWRLMLRGVGSSPEGRLWFASRGAELFPASPSLRVAHCLALVESAESPNTCAAACVEMAATLSSQCAARLLAGTNTGTACAKNESQGKPRNDSNMNDLGTSSQDGTHSVMDSGDVDVTGVRWASQCARYVAYGIAATAVAIAPRDASAAASILASASVPGRFCLLPLAQQNLTLLHLLLEETGRLDGVAALPLAVISDVPFALAPTHPPVGEAAVRLLSRQLTLQSCAAENGISAPYVDAARAAIHTSLISAFAADGRVAQAILARVPESNEAALIAAWAAELDLIERRDGTEPMVALLRQIAESPNTATSPLFTLLITLRLAQHAADVDGDSDDSNIKEKDSSEIMLERLAERYAGVRAVMHTPLDAWANVSDVPSVEWIPFLILRARRLPPMERTALLLRIPTSRYMEAVELVLLVWLELLCSAVLEGTDTAFRRAVTHGLLLLREPFLHYYSALDCFFDDMVSLAHTGALWVFRAVPIFLGTYSQAAPLYRQIVLDVAQELHVVHPLLMKEES